MLDNSDNLDNVLLVLQSLLNEINKDWDDELLPILISSVCSLVVVLLDEFLDDRSVELKRQAVALRRSLRLHTQRPRGPRVQSYNHGEALQCIYRDFLGNVPKFPGDQFKTFFRISRQRFIKLMNDVVATGDSFYTDRRGPSLEAMLLLPIQVLALGISPGSLCHYYQMSPMHANEACFRFDNIMYKIYQKQYLSQPTVADIKNIVSLHRRKHRVPGLMGSLDCTHMVWKNCPKAWEGSFKGKEKKTTIVLEACCDYNHYFWHASFGYPGTLNDVNILRFSSLFIS
jgi:hypothetical protein